MRTSDLRRHTAGALQETLGGPGKRDPTGGGGGGGAISNQTILVQSVPPPSKARLTHYNTLWSLTDCSIRTFFVSKLAAWGLVKGIVQRKMEIPSSTHRYADGGVGEV